MPFALELSDEARRVLAAVTADASHGRIKRKIERTLAQLQVNPRHPGLSTHRYQSKQGPQGEPIWEAYVENRTPGAWRVWFWYGPEQGVITILAIGPHPD